MAEKWWPHQKCVAKSHSGVCSASGAVSSDHGLAESAEGSVEGEKKSKIVPCGWLAELDAPRRIFGARSDSPAGYAFAGDA